MPVPGIAQQHVHRQLAPYTRSVPDITYQARRPIAHVLPQPTLRLDNVPQLRYHLATPYAMSVPVIA
eukprot:2448888-Rhodomonas_salina.1